VTDAGHSAPTAGVARRASRLGAAARAVLVAAVAAVFLHLAAGPGHLDDVDAINFTLGVRDFDVAKHQPHPPGYPVLIAVGKLGAGAAHALGGLSWMVPAMWTAVPVETAVLSLVAILAGGLLAAGLFPLARAACGDDEAAVAAVLLALASPLAFVTASRPLSDVPGLAAALGVQAMLARAFVAQRGWRGREVSSAELAATGRLVVLAAFAAGLALGVRTQTGWLTLPLLGLVIADRAGRAAAAAIVGSAVTFVVGVLAWAIPLVIAAGGPGAYWGALSSQAGEDLEGVDMLFTSTRPLWRLAMNLLQTFVLPWGPLPIAVLVLGLAAVGALLLARRHRPGLVLLAGAFGPYAIYHLVWQENVTTRYALPVLPAIAILAAAALRGIAPSPVCRWALRAGAAGLTVACLATAVPALTAYTREPAPVFRLFRDMRHAGAAGDVIVAMHRRAFMDTQRVRGWAGAEAFPWRLLPAPSGHEWLQLVQYWRDGGRARTWLLADASRTDLALIDPASRHANGHYAWSMADAAGVLGGTRPGALDWVVIDGPPAWFLGEGWSLSPEIAGVAERDRKGPSRGGATGWIRRVAGPRRLVVGGRNLGGPDAPIARFVLTVAGHPVDTWDVRPAPGFFLRAIDLPARTGGPGVADADAFDALMVTAVAADGSARPVAASVEQFGLQPADRVQIAFGEGWHEDELQPRTGLRWRWSSGRALLHVWPVDRDVRIRLEAESPLKTFAEAPIVTVSAGGRELARSTPDDAFAIDVVVPADALRASGGQVAVATSRTFVPAEHVGAGDPRRGDRRALGLRVFAVSADDASRVAPQR
jgi:hypothetical protein